MSRTLLSVTAYTPSTEVMSDMGRKSAFPTSA